MSSAKFMDEAYRLEETKRRRRELIVIAVTAVMVAIYVFFEVQLPDVTAEYSLGSNIGFFLLININIILLILLLFLVIRNIVKFLFERKKGILGTKLRGRLVLAFITLSLVPTVLLFIVAIGFVTRSFGRWFDTQVETALQGALEIGQTYYQNSANNALFFARELSHNIADQNLLAPARSSDLKAFIKTKQEEYNLGRVELFAADRRLLAAAANDRVPRAVGTAPDSEFLSRALRGLEVTRTQEYGEGEVIRGGGPLRSADNRILGALIIDYYVPKRITNRATQISRSYEEYKQLSSLKTPIKNSYILAMLLVTLVIIFAASWFGLYLARSITGPIQQLAVGTHEVALGNWDYKIESRGDDEIGVLVDSFNQMTRDLKQINLELERRGKFVETLLANIAAGVISVNPSGIITTWNKAAEKLLRVDAANALGKDYESVFDPELLRPMRQIVESARAGGEVERELKMGFIDQLQTVMVTAASLHDADDNTLGVMVFVEDITQIQKVQRMEAWREVARRIAHEIKNPLTPIQLSAERLRKRYAPMLEGDGAILDKCTSTIIQQVEELKTLVNEFSQFARLPAARLTTQDLNEIVQEALFLFQEGHKEIRFEFRRGELPPLELDRDLIKRVLMNLLDNAVGAVEQTGAIWLTTSYDRDREIVYLEVADNGSGIPAELRARIFEPYFSTKKNGTGLGLTIVSQIIEDHRGYIRIRPNDPKGTRFILELPAPDVTRHAAETAITA